MLKAKPLFKPYLVMQQWFLVSLFVIKLLSSVHDRITPGFISNQKCLGEILEILF